MKSKNNFLKSPPIRNVKSIKIEELKAWNTRQLLSRIDALRRLHDFHYYNDLSLKEIDIALNLQNASVAIFFKNSEIWKKAFQDVKSILKDREHIPRGSKAKRQQAAWEKKHR